MKKIIGLAAIAGVTLSLSACASKPADNAATEVNATDENISDTLPADESSNAADLAGDNATGDNVADNATAP